MYLHLKFLFGLLFVSIIGNSQAVGTASIPTAQIRAQFTAVAPITLNNGVIGATFTQAQIDSVLKGCVFINTGNGAKLIRVTTAGDSAFVKTLVAGTGVVLDTTGSTVTINATAQATAYPIEAVRTYSATFTVASDDVNCIYAGTAAGSVTLPAATSFPNRVIYIINKSTFPLTVNGSTLSGRRAVKIISSGGSWVNAYATTIESNF